MEEKLLLVKYQDNFADNFTSYAYGKIISKKAHVKYFYENCPKNRENFENIMSDFNLRCDYISKNRAEQVTKNALKNKKIHLNGNFKRKKQYVDECIFNLNDIDLISADIMNDFKFSNSDFLINFDILEEINNTNSIGLYINSNDKPDYNYINRALKRLNKYLKQPKLFIFANKDFNINSKLFLDYKKISIDDYREEFYLLKNCKHKIILNTQKSYSAGFWASILNQKSYHYIVYDKNIKTKKMNSNWLKV